MTLEFLIGHYPYYLVSLLLVIGVYGMTRKRNLLKKVVGMTIFQTAIFLFFIQGATKIDATIPIRDAELGVEPELYINPLPQVLILTAIVVGVAITGVALALLLNIYRTFGTLDEEEILQSMGEGR